MHIIETNKEGDSNTHCCQQTGARYTLWNNKGHDPPFNETLYGNPSFLERIPVCGELCHVPYAYCAV